MIIFLLALVLLAGYKAKFMKFNADYMGITQTSSVKGIFIVMVILSHSRGYTDTNIFWGVKYMA